MNSFNVVGCEIGAFLAEIGVQLLHVFGQDVQKQSVAHDVVPTSSVLEFSRNCFAYSGSPVVKLCQNGICSSVLLFSCYLGSKTIKLISVVRCQIFLPMYEKFLIYPTTLTNITKLGHCIEGTIFYAFLYSET